MPLKSYLIAFSLLSIFFVSCKDDKNLDAQSEKREASTTMFTQIPATKSNVHFSNTIKGGNSFNFLNYTYIYLGGGLAAGDINNDGLVDLYFGANQNNNQLYLNKGNFEFDDITASAKVASKEGWTTGVSMIDINNDGWLDIYVCKSASMNNPKLRENKLYINQKNNTFSEEGEKWGLNDPGYSIQAYFFDFDKDGDLDLYVVNHRSDFNNNGKINSSIQKNIVQEFSDQLYRNEGTHFVNVSKQAGIQNKAWGLSATIADFNQDGWPDVYVCNDYLEPDNLYINQKDGTFKDDILNRFRHISFNSMGSDIADINNDTYLDLCVLDMTPSDHKRSKENMASMDTKGFNTMVQIGYHHQYMLNHLQINNGEGQYMDVGQMANIAKTDWSWGPLMADFDDDGYKDIYITNGIQKDISNRDFRINIRRKNQLGESMRLDDLLNQIPSKRISNYVFKNTHSLRFADKTKDWGLNQPSFSSGAAYADLDNDGDLDIIVNNAIDKAFIYKNNSKNNSLQIKLKGPSKNRFAIGAKVQIKNGEDIQVQELRACRGFQSSVAYTVHFGIGKNPMVDEVIVTWPDGKESRKNNVKANKTLVFDYVQAKAPNNTEKLPVALLQRVENSSIGLTGKHQENVFNDFSKQVLLPHSESKNGPFIAAADVNGDQLEDVFVGGALGQPGQLYLQQANATFKKASDIPWRRDKDFEDLGVLFLDYDGDGDKDLYVVSGGAEREAPSKFFQDRLYKNDGHGNFVKTNGVLPTISFSGQSVCASDVDKDGDLDLFVGGRILPNQYPYSPQSALLINDKGIYHDMTDKLAPDLKKIGMVSKAIFSDYDGDGDDDILAVGEWSKIQIFENANGHFTKKEIKGLADTRGLWFSIKAMDMDQDGDKDYFVGNLGLNAKYHATPKKEFHVFCEDFDQSGTYDIVLSDKYQGELVPIRGKQCSTEQMPDIQSKFPSYKQFAEASVTDMFTDEQLKNALHYQANTLSSMYLENLGHGEFAIHLLPNEVQKGPILDFEFIDLDDDGKEEVICIGNMYNTEVETTRYDASMGSILKFSQNNFKAIHPIKTGLHTHGDAKDMVQINMPNKEKWIIVTNNNSYLDIFRKKP